MLNHLENLKKERDTVEEKIKKSLEKYKQNNSIKLLANAALWNKSMKKN